MSERQIVVLSAGLGTPSSSRLLADQLAQATSKSLDAQGVESHVHTVELRDYAVDIANNFVAGFPSPRLERLISRVENADGIIAVSPVFTASYSGLFKSFFDVIDPKGLEGTPVLLGATAGTDRHQLVIDFAMRPLFAYLRARVTSTAVFAGPRDWGTTDEGGRGSILSERVERAGSELAGLIQAAPARQRADDMATLPFEQLLAGITAED